MLLPSEDAQSGGTFKLPSLSATIKSYWPLFFFLLIGTCHGVIAARKMELQHSEAPIPKTHSNFFRFAVRGRQRELSCSGDPAVCADRERNPWGGDTCCFGRYCKDTTRDGSHCGACGRACAYGLVCCGGECVDVRSDPHNCGSCFEECPAQSRCSYAMCDYGG